MNKMIKIIFYFVLVFSFYHLTRDLLTNLGFHNIFLDIFHRPQTYWCKSACSWITIPPEVFNIVATTYLLLKDKFGILGFIVVLQIPIWLIFILLIP